MEGEKGLPDGCVRGGTELCLTVCSIRAQNAGAEIAVGVLVECGEHREQKSFLLSAEQYACLRPEKGALTEEQYDRLEEASALYAAVRCGERLLAYGANSVQMLTRKLVQHGFGKEVAGAAARLLSERGILDESSDVRREVERCVRKLWGSKRITAHLWSRGYGAEQLADWDALYGDIDFPAQCALLIVKHFGGVPEDADARRRMVGFLSRYGYSLAEIRQAVKQLSEE